MGDFYFGGDLGLAKVELHRDNTQDNGTWLYGALRAEYALRDQLLLGVEGSGWTNQDSISSPISEDVMAFMITAKIYPLQSGIFVKAGSGYVKHRYWESPSPEDTSGTGYIVGLGMDYEIFTLSMLYSNGDLNQETYKAYTISLGFTF